MYKLLILLGLFMNANIVQTEESNDKFLWPEKDKKKDNVYFMEIVSNENIKTYGG